MPTNVSPLVGGRLCLDFANAATLPASPPVEPLRWEHLIVFLEKARIVTAERGDRLMRLTQTDPLAAEGLLAQANRLRAASRQIFSAVARGKHVAVEWVAPINSILRITEGHDEIAWNGNAWRMEFVAREEGLEWLLAAIARSAAELIAEGPKAPVRLCANPSCSLFFYDDSRTRRRRWCTMTLCGNRHKVAEFARRKHAVRRDA
jgi:predicted RNA-binding Zn ribbon-like protein